MPLMCLGYKPPIPGLWHGPKGTEKGAGRALCARFAGALVRGAFWSFGPAPLPRRTGAPRSLDAAVGPTALRASPPSQVWLEGEQA